MKVHIDADLGDINDDTAESIVSALSHHLGRHVELVGDDEETIQSGPSTALNSGYESQILSDREERLKEEIADILEGGPPRGHERIGELGKLFVRDRLDRIFDEVRYECGTFASYDRDERLPADGLIAGVGTINGREVFFTANDYTVKAGSGGHMGNEKIIRMTERAAEARKPILYLIDSTGARLDSEQQHEGETHADRYTGGKSFFYQSINSGQIPQIGVLYGPDIAGSAYTPVFCDYLIIVKEIGAMAIASPRIVRQMIGEDVDMQSLGGWQVHARESGSVDVVVPDEAGAATAVQDLLSYLPQDHAADLPDRPTQPPDRNPADLDLVIPEDSAAPYDVLEVIEHLVDGDSWFELKPEFAPELVTGFARIDGSPIGIVANQPNTNSGAIFPDSAEKGAGFVWKCDAFGIPLLFLCDTPGFMIGSQVEQNGILQKGRKMIFAVSNAQVPTFCVITRKAYGAGIFAMAGPAFEPDGTLALPTAEIAVMGPDAAVRAMYAKQIEEIDDAAERKAFIDEHKEKYRKDIRKQASRMQVDELLPPSDLRDHLINQLDTFADKRRVERDRYHSSILF